MKIQRKPRKNLTKQMVNLIIAMMQSEKFSVKEIASRLQITRQTVWKVMKTAKMGERFLEASEKRKLTCLSRNAKINTVDEIIFNTAAKENSLTQQEITNRVREQNGLDISRSTVSRKLRKMNVCMKKPDTSPSIENNNDINIDTGNAEAVNDGKIRQFCHQNDDYPQNTSQNDLPNSSNGIPCAVENMPTAHVEMVEECFDNFPRIECVTYNENINNEELENMENGLDVIQDLMPRSKEMLKLQQELAEVETKYYRNKTFYLNKLNENSKYKQSLMLLQSRKLQLEIEKMQTE